MGAVSVACNCSTDQHNVHRLGPLSYHAAGSRADNLQYAMDTFKLRCAACRGDNTREKQENLLLISKADENEMGK